MPARYLLDTNTVSYIIKGNLPRVRERLVQTPMAQVTISVITEAELLFGIARRPEAERLKVAVGGIPAARRSPAVGFRSVPSLRQREGYSRAHRY